MLHVPLFVQLHVSKGGKFVPTRKKTSVQTLLQGLPNLKRRLLLDQVFKDKTNTRNSKCRVPSNWQPPANQQVDRFIRLLSESIATFEPLPFRSNMSWLDKKARAWLNQHANEVAVIDCDKGLGEAIVPKTWIDQQVCKQLSLGYVQLDMDSFQKRISDQKARAAGLIDYFAVPHVLSFQEQRYLYSGFCKKSAGIFRINAKVHKNPVASRPICNLRNVWLEPFANILVEKLGSLVSSLTTVITSTDDFLQKIGSRPIPAGFRLVTVDFVNLYPSIDRIHFLSVITPWLRKRICNFDLCSFLINCLNLVLNACCVSYKNDIFQSQDGIPTGLAFASIIANIYLSELDRKLVHEYAEHLWFYGRYIDDIIAVTSLESETLVSQINSWRGNLRVELSGENAVNFLDLALWLENQVVCWSLYSKPMNLFLYVPADSNHPLSSFKSIVTGGYVRCVRRNKAKADFEHNWVKFQQRLKDRGFSLTTVNTILQQYQMRKNSREKTMKVRKCYLKLPFNRDVKVSWLRSTVQKHQHLLKQIAAAEVGISWRINQNLLKRNYRLAWTRWVVGGTANFLRSCLHAMVWGLLDFEFQLPHTKSEHFSAQFQPEESIDESSH